MIGRRDHEYEKALSQCNEVTERLRDINSSATSILPDAPTASLGSKVTKVSKRVISSCQGLAKENLPPPQNLTALAK